MKSSLFTLICEILSPSRNETIEQTSSALRHCSCFDFKKLRDFGCFWTSVEDQHECEEQLSEGVWHEIMPIEGCVMQNDWRWRQWVNIEEKYSVWLKNFYWLLPRYTADDRRINKNNQTTWVCKFTGKKRSKTDVVRNVFQETSSCIHLKHVCMPWNRGESLPTRKIVHR